MTEHGASTLLYFTHRTTSCPVNSLFTAVQCHRHSQSSPLGDASAELFTLFYAGNFPTFPRNEKMTLKCLIKNVLS